MPHDPPQVSGFASETARRHLLGYAWRLSQDSMVSEKQAEHVRWVAEQMAKEFLELRRQVQVLTEQRDHARDTAVRYEQMLARTEQIEQTPA